MSLLRVLIAIVWFSTVFAASSVWTRAAAHRHASPIAPAPSADTTSVLDAGVNPLHTGHDDWTEPRVDLNGNEVDAAVGDYRVDKRGEMYERHAPDTALLHLGAPLL
jgi:hypothetical protein